MLQLIGGLVVGIISSLCAAVLWERLSRGKQAKSIEQAIAGKWSAWWQTNSGRTDGSAEVMETVIIKPGWRYISIENKESSGSGYRWVANVKIVDTDLIGEWHSLKNPKSRGTIILSLPNQALPPGGRNMLVGFFLGPNALGFRNFGALVMTPKEGTALKEGATLEDIEFARQTLGKMGPTLRKVFGEAGRGSPSATAPQSPV